MARAHEVLDTPADEDDADADEVTDADEPAEEPAAAVAVDEVTDAAQDERDVTDDEVVADTEPAADVTEGEHVPAELLAPAEALEARADVIDALEASLSRRLKRHLADEQNEVLDLLRRTGATTVDDLLPDADAHVGGYAELALGDLSGAATAGAAAVDPAAAPPDVHALADALGTTIVEPFRRRLDRATTEVAGDADELDERLRSLYREWKVAAHRAGGARCAPVRLRPGHARRRSGGCHAALDHRPGTGPLSRRRGQRPGRRRPRGRGVPDRRRVPPGPPGVPVPAHRGAGVGNRGPAREGRTTSSG